MLPFGFNRVKLNKHYRELFAEGGIRGHSNSFSIASRPSLAELAVIKEQQLPVF